MFCIKTVMIAVPSPVCMWNKIEHLIGNISIIHSNMLDMAPLRCVCLCHIYSYIPIAFASIL